jgi:hypothetical protein
MHPEAVGFVAIHEAQVESAVVVGFGFAIVNDLFELAVGENRSIS